MTKIIVLTFFTFLSLHAHAGKKSKKSCEIMLAKKAVDGAVMASSFNPSDSWGRQLIELKLDTIAEVTKRTEGMPVPEKLKIIIDEDIRKTLYHIQSLFRVYEHKDKKFYKPMRTIFKDLEGKLGFSDLQKTLKKKAKELNLLDLADYFAKRQSDSLAELGVMFAALDSAKIESIREQLRDHRGWQKGKDDRKFLIEQLAKELTGIHKDAKKSEFDNADIELGLHELRRRVRWAVFQVISLNHLVQYQREEHLSTPVTNWFNELVAKNPDVKNNKLMILDQAATDKPVYIPLQMQTILTSIVNEVGKFKDYSELQIELRSGMKAIGYSEAKIEAAMAALSQNIGIGEVDHHKLSRDLEKRIADTRILLEYAEQLEKMN